MVVLEIGFVLFVLYLLTQIVIPLIFPNDFKINWLFVKDKSLESKVEELKGLKNELQNETKNIKNVGKENLQKAKNINKKINKL